MARCIMSTSRLTKILIASLCLPPFPFVLGYQWPGDPRHDMVEKFIYEGTRADGLGFFGPLADCGFRITGPDITSTTVAATWLRFAYHDSATFNITDGTGGVDGSIHFELDRAEACAFNIGKGMTSTQTEYQSFSTKYISNADIIAIGAAGAVADCGGPLIALRTGRVDAQKAGKPGVPEPEQDLKTHTEKFRLQGFNATEMIELVACGHTMGGVESEDFPLIVDIRPKDPSFTSISASFDNTTNKFDTSVVDQYLDGTTQNPLVVSRNVTGRSDLRIFSSDGNITMNKLSNPNVFQSRCATLFEKMLDTVPTGVQLSEPIEVLPEVPHASTGLQIVNDTVTFTTALRLARSISEPFLDGSRVSLHWCDRYGDDADCKSGFSNRIQGAPQAFSFKGSPIMVRSNREFRIYPFQAPIQPSRSISHFWFEIASESTMNQPVRIDNAGQKYPVIQDDIIYVKMLSSQGSSGTAQINGGPGSAASGVQIQRNNFVVVGIRAELQPTSVHVELYDNTFDSNPSGLVITPTNITQALVRNTTLPDVPGYSLYSASVDVVGTGPLMDFIVDVGGKKTTLPDQPTSFGRIFVDNRFLANLGTVERVVYVDTPATSTPTSSALTKVLTVLPCLPPFPFVLGYQWPGDPRHDMLEKFIYEGTRADGLDFFVPLADCGFRFSGPGTSDVSTTVAATWLRFVNGTGGVDGSIHFELDRAENIGNGMTTTQSEYQSFSTKYISNADIIAIGAAGAVADCGGPIIPLRIGRVDAQKAGNPGVPEPEQDLQTHTEKFRLQGFNTTEMIELVACGHTMGGVESEDFPLIVDIRPKDPTLPSVSASFDNTTNKFDTSVVDQYLDGTTQNPLVVSRNVTGRSDLRIFSSDGNVTMNKLSDPNVFQSRCATLFEKMLNTVPTGVQLSEPIEVLPDVPHASTGLQIVNDTVTFTTALRLARPISDAFVDGSRVAFHWCDRYGDDADCKSGFSNRIQGSPQAFRLKGSPLMVRSNREFRIYPFQALIQPSRSISHFWFEIDPESTTDQPVRIDNSGQKYPVIQDDIIYVKMLSGQASSGTVQINGSRGSSAQVKQNTFVVVGIRAELQPTSVHLELFDNTFDSKPSTITPTNLTQVLVRNTALQHAPGYSLYSASVDFVGTGPLMDFIVDVGGKKTTLPDQPASFGRIFVDNRFFASLGTVERVAYVDTPSPSTPPTPGPTSGAVQLQFFGYCEYGKADPGQAYHDSATFNIEDGTGGVDGSIHFELDRAENIGRGMTITQSEYQSFPTKYISNADIIAIGAAGAIANCGGPIIPLRVGRVDAQSAGNRGVPEPMEDLQTHTEKFRLHGFNATEMIELVACGHTMGGVESADFPLIVDVRPTLPRFPSASASFDNTTNKFDNSIVAQYLDGTTQDPLVVSRNVSARSDLRIFSSDGNVTMNKLSDPNIFQSRCVTLIERMLNTVPAGVQLSEPIDVLPEIPHASTGLQIVNGSVTFTTSLRLARSISEPFINGSRVSLHWCDRYGDDADCKSGFSNRIQGAPQEFRLNGSPMMVRSNREFRIYPFHAPIQPSRSISRFWFEIDSENTTDEPVRVDNAGQKYPVIQDDIIYVTTLSSAGLRRTVRNDPTGSVGTDVRQHLFVVAGVREELQPNSVYLELFDNTFDAKPSNITPTNLTHVLVRNTTLPDVPGYTLYSANLDFVGTGPTMDLIVDVGGEKKILPDRPSCNLYTPDARPNVRSTSSAIRATRSATLYTHAPALYWIHQVCIKGFNSTEMIELVACGHTMGGVESADFPLMVDIRPDNSSTVDSISASFDSTIQARSQILILRCKLSKPFSVETYTR
ncbi:hypothetical protein CVT24_013073 [Panaeolus cyanescens]|uniref:Peroxidase n=1 Tax=Panaeolus cyanescens TaxID=181874 RepID=A0A409WDJ8_9AGAR|nr:hypothetical protein CVT24_013073 [Panaeolus cyanescens]